MPRDFWARPFGVPSCSRAAAVSWAALKMGKSWCIISLKLLRIDVLKPSNLIEFAGALFSGEC